jgi:putative transcriptional regulator
MDHTGSDPKAGRLLVATPILGDPNFKRAVVLIVEHEDVQGTLGVVLNRPTTIGVGQVLEQWTDLATEPSVVFRGGPVAPNSALALAMVPGKDEPVGWRALDGAPALARLGLLDLDTPPRLLAPAITSLRVYAGYSGWSPGQLEAEIDEGAWYVLTAQPGDVFAADPDRLWRQVLRRQDGDMAFLATYPDDPSQNLPGGRPPDPPMSGSAGPNDFGLLARGERLRARGVRGPARRAAGPSRETVSFGT